MADNIFDAQNARRIQHLQQQSVSNIIKINPNLRGVLTRYEDAEVSRLKLLELQRLRNKKITSGEKALLKAVAKGRRGGRIGRGGKKVKRRVTIPVPDADGVVRNRTRVVEVEEFIGKDQLIGEGGSADPIDPELARDKLRLEQEKFRQEQEFRREQIYLQERQETARLADLRDIAFQNREQLRAIEDRSIRDRDFAERQLQDIRDRVAREDARRHAELQKTQELALEQLANQNRDNERRHQEELNKIQNQRSVDAERSITDREKEQTFQQTINLFDRQGVSELPSGKGLVEDIDTDSLSGTVIPLDSSLKQLLEPEPEPEAQTTLSSQTVKSVPSEQRADDLRKFERRDIDDPIIEGQPTPGALREKPKQKVIPGAATEAEIERELAETSTETTQQTTSANLTPIQQNLFQSPAGQEFAKQVELSVKSLSSATGTPIERNLEKIVEDVQSNLYDKEPEPSTLGSK